MKKHSLVLLYCVTLAYCFMFSSCSNNSDGLTSQEKALITKWLFISDHNYYCNTNELYSESFASSEFIFEYSKNGTFTTTENNDGEIKTYAGTWELSKDNKLYIRYDNFDPDDFEIYIVEFKDSNNTIVLRSEDDCKSGNSSEIYSEEVFKKM